MRLLGIVAFLLLLVGCNIHPTASNAKTLFDGTWDSVKNELTRYKFSGDTYEAFHELDSKRYRGTFSYSEEITPGMGTITFVQTHSADQAAVDAAVGEWEEDEETWKTNYEFINSTTLEIISREYRKKS
jgi:hypothetical protein